MDYKISKKFAKIIVDELKNLADTNFNFMDETGVIIAAKDIHRIGTIHSGAKRILEEGLDELYISKEMEDAYTKEGLNLPIKIYGRTVGVIGISGKLDDIKKYGSIVKRMTEIMLEDSMRKEDIRLKRHIKYRFIEDWIHERNSPNQKAFIERGLGLGIDIRIKRRAISFKIDKLSEINTDIDGHRKIETIENEIRRFLEGHQTYIYIHLPSHYTVFVDVNDRNYVDDLKKLQAYIYEEYGEELIFGIGCEVEKDLTQDKAYKQSIRAMELAASVKSSFLFYDQMIIENFLYEIPSDRMLEYMSNFMKNDKDTKREDTISLINAYFECEGSISKMSEKLFVHANTIQYRMQKMKENIGFDIRKPSEAIYFHLYLKFYNFIGNKE